MHTVHRQPFITALILLNIYIHLWLVLYCIFNKTRPFILEVLQISITNKFRHWLILWNPTNLCFSKLSVEYVFLMCCNLDIMFQFHAMTTYIIVVSFHFLQRFINRFVFSFSAIQIKTSQYRRTFRSLIRICSCQQMGA